VGSVGEKMFGKSKYRATVESDWIESYHTLYMGPDLDKAMLIFARESMNRKDIRQDNWFSYKINLCRGSEVLMTDEFERVLPLHRTTYI
jgi:hypothetical protein